MVKTLVAHYKEGLTGQYVVEALLEAGFSGDDISLMVKNVNDSLAHVMKEELSAEEGAEFGALVGALVGIGSALMPGMGPLLGTGALGVIVTAGISAIVGALTGGIAAELLDLGWNEDETLTDSDALRSGTTVSVTTTDQWWEWAETIMKRHRPLKIEEREARWFEQDWAFHAHTRNEEALSAAPLSQYRSDWNGGSVAYQSSPPSKRVRVYKRKHL